MKKMRLTKEGGCFATVGFAFGPAAGFKIIESVGNATPAMAELATGQPLSPDAKAKLVKATFNAVEAAGFAIPTLLSLSLIEFEETSS